MAFTDNFNRADEDFPTGNWTAFAGTAAAGVRSNKLASLATSGQGRIFLCPDQGNRNQYVQFTVEDVTTTDPESYVVLRAEADDTYVAVRNSQDFYVLRRRVAGTFTNLYVADHNIVVGDTIRVEVEEDNYRAYLNGVQVSTGAIGATMNSTRSGIAARLVTQNPFVDNFENGLLTSGATGDLDATESGSDVAAFIGSLPIEGALVVTESGSDIAEIIGAIPVSGALAATEVGSDAVLFTGKVFITGTLVASEIGSDIALFYSGDPPTPGTGNAGILILKLTKQLGNEWF